MPYILSPEIREDLPSLWFEGRPYEKQNIYSIVEGKNPPVNYDSHLLRVHSLTHVETPRHTNVDGNLLEFYFANPKYFYGRCTVVKLKGNKYLPSKKVEGVYHWEVSLKELQECISNPPEKLLLTSESCPVNEFGYHDPKYVLTLSQEAANWLVSEETFHLWGTSWKSTDFQPGSSIRPIHNTLFQQAIIFECLDLKEVPEGEYFFVGFPLRIKDASESPVTPILFNNDEIPFDL